MPRQPHKNSCQWKNWIANLKKNKKINKIIFGYCLLLKTENWKHCRKIIFKCVNSTIGSNFKVDFARFRACGSHEQCMRPTEMKPMRPTKMKPNRTEMCKTCYLNSCLEFYFFLSVSWLPNIFKTVMTK